MEKKKKKKLDNLNINLQERINKLNEEYKRLRDKKLLFEQQLEQVQNNILITKGKYDQLVELKNEANKKPTGK